MRELLLIDLAICAAVIVVAAALMLLRRRSGRSRMPLQEQPGSVARLADQGLSGREAADVPVSGHDIAKPDPGTQMPAGPEQVAEPKVSAVAATEPGPDGLAAEPDAPAVAGPATVSERVRGYYQEADRPVAGYLAARGWTERPGTPGQVADADAAPVSREAAAGPDTARRRLAA